jgi:2,4-dienoyl-CoA reductase-like NADH-dependent reductase (Old Yellow Enzyme family)/thioredoxin reductase
VERIYEPIDIKGVHLPNRICRPGHGTFLGNQGAVSDELVAYHRERAKDGVGLLFLDLATVHPSSDMHSLRSWDDSIIDGYRKVTDAVHAHGTKMFHQIVHGGFHWPTGDGSPPWSASVTVSPLLGIPSIAMTKDQIDVVVEGFARAARRAELGGLDGVEVHAGHGYLITAFLSPLTNRRTDSYGGDLAGRSRLFFEVLRAVRAAVSEEFVVGIRISDDFLPGGLTAQECAVLVAQAEDEDLIDYVNGSQGTYYTFANFAPPMGTPVGALLPSAGPIVAVARNIPRIVCGRFHTLDDAEQVLVDGIADMVGMVRPFIAEPRILHKTRAGRAGEIRPCLACNEGCIGGLFSPMARIGCVVNPAVGYEDTMSEDLITSASSPRKVVVVGGGPAGMEAGRVAALCGHDVVLLEAASRLGGQELLARRVARMASVGNYLDWHERELNRLHVKVSTSTRADVDTVLGEHPDVVIIATGGVETQHRTPVVAPGERIDVDPDVRVHGVAEVLGSDADLGGQAYLVFDDTGGYEPVAAADHLLCRGASVTFVTRREKMAAGLGLVGRSEPVLQDFYRTGRFALHTNAIVTGVGPDTATVRRLGDTTTFTVPISAAMLIGPRRPLTELATALRERLPDVRVVGDALSPRNLQSAIHEAHRAARTIA